MRKTVLGTVVCAALVVAGCGEAGEGDVAGTVSQQETVEAPSSEAESPEPESVPINEPFEISQLPDNDVFLTVNEITVGEECRYGVWAPGYENDDLGDDKQYLQIWVEVSADQVDNPQSQGQAYLSDPKTVDADGFTKEADLAVDCQESNENYEHWYLPTAAGDKSRRYAAFIVPKGISEIQIYDRIYEVQ